LRKRLVKRGCFLGAQLQHGLIFKRFDHGRKIGLSPTAWKDFEDNSASSGSKTANEMPENNKGDTLSPFSPTEAG
jgi:hypothetical protein